MAAVQSMHVLSSIDKLAHGMADLYDVRRPSRFTSYGCAVPKLWLLLFPQKEFEEQIERLSNAAKLMEEMGKTAEVRASDIQGPIRQLIYASPHSIGEAAARRARQAARADYQCKAARVSSEEAAPDVRPRHPHRLLF